jgi:DNA-binding NarL/FixJ family response regulator
VLATEHCSVEQVERSWHHGARHGEVSERAATTVIRVLIVHEHPIYAEGVRLLLAADAPDVEVVGMASTAAEAESAARASAPDIVLMSHVLQGPGSGIDATTAIRRTTPRCAMLMLSEGANKEEQLAAAEAGACGFLSRTAAPRDLISAIRRAAAGETLYSQETLGTLFRERRQRDRDAVERLRLLADLTPREREVIELMAQGLDTKGIAGRMSVSLHTARGYAQNVLGKLDAHSRVEAVVRATKLGVVRISA